MADGRPSGRDITAAGIVSMIEEQAFRERQAFDPRVERSAPEAETAKRPNVGLQILGGLLKQRIGVDPFEAAAGPSAASDPNAAFGTVGAPNLDLENPDIQRRLAGLNDAQRFMLLDQKPGRVAGIFADDKLMRKFFPEASALEAEALADAKRFNVAPGGRVMSGGGTTLGENPALLDKSKPGDVIGDPRTGEVVRANPQFGNVPANNRRVLDDPFTGRTLETLPAQTTRPDGSVNIFPGVTGDVDKVNQRGMKQELLDQAKLGGLMRDAQGAMAELHELGGGVDIISRVKQGGATFLDKFNAASEDQKALIRAEDNLKVKLATAMNAMINALSGAAVSQAEAKRLLKQLPDPSETSTTVMLNRMQQVIDLANMGSATYRTWINQGGSSAQHQFAWEVNREDVAFAIDARLSELNQQFKDFNPDASPAQRQVAVLRSVDQEFGMSSGGALQILNDQRARQNREQQNRGE